MCHGVYRMNIDDLKQSDTTVTMALNKHNQDVRIRGTVKPYLRYHKSSGPRVI